jgi:hypothetical protein
MGGSTCWKLTRPVAAAEGTAEQQHHERVHVANIHLSSILAY